MIFKKKFLLLLLLIFAASLSNAQNIKITIAGMVKDAKTSAAIEYVNVIIKQKTDLKFVTGTITDSTGRFKLADLSAGNYVMEFSIVGYQLKSRAVVVGSLNTFLDLDEIILTKDVQTLDTVNIVGQNIADGLSDKMDKKTFNLSNNIAHSGGSVLQAMQNLPGVTLQDGKIQLRGNDKVAVLVDGKQNAMTGFGTQTGLDNIPASAIERIEIINNPSSKYDANGNAGIINIIYKKNKQEGFNGKIGLTTGLGSLWERRENLPTIRPQFQATQKINPSLSFNYRKNKINTFLQGDYLYTQTLNRNEFATRRYSDGTIINQQVKRNRTTDYTTVKTGVDWNPDEQNSLTISAYFNREKIIDKGDIPYFNGDMQRLRLWQFLEDEVKYTVTGSASYQHQFKQPGHLLHIGLNYTWHREDEKYFFTNIMPTFTGEDSFALLSDEHVTDFNLDYIRPLNQGRIEMGLKFRKRNIPTNMQFFPGLNSPIDVNAGGWADYKETIPAAYANYILETNYLEMEAGLRFEYVKVQYDVNPNHNTYQSDGYDYARPFPNLRLAYKIDAHNKLSIFYNRRVDRPNEVDIRIFPKYDEPELLKVGNPTLRPQFTNTIELGYRLNWQKGNIYAAAYHKIINATITRIATQVLGNNILYYIFQNAGRSSQTGGETVLQQELAPWYSFTTSAAIYRNKINAFTINNSYPVPTVYTMAEESITSGNLKLNNMFKLKGQMQIQLSGVYLAKDIIPQGTIGSRFSVDLGIKKQIQKGKGELFLNGTDIFGTLKTRRSIIGNGFTYESTDYLETQVFRLGYSYKF
jgi:outer membrane receptor protein involved in Fe transport